jgi:UDP-3-O-[3-hydroxymyristoyl] glucosamine N-acyltransferase
MDSENLPNGAFVHHTAVVNYNAVIIEKGAYIGPFCVIGQPGENLKTWKEKPTGKVIIGAGAKLTKFVTVDAPVAKDGVTRVGKNCFLMAHSHIGHDAIIGDFTVIACGVKIGGFARILYKCFLGLNAVINPRVIVPPFCKIGAGVKVSVSDYYILDAFKVLTVNRKRIVYEHTDAVKHWNLTEWEVERERILWNRAKDNLYYETQIAGKEQ